MCDHKIRLTAEHFTCSICGFRWGRNDFYPEGPGTRLYNKLHEIGVPMCDECTVRRFQMDIWGDEGCKRHKADILQFLRLEVQRALVRGHLNEMIWNWLISDHIVQ